MLYVPVKGDGLDDISSENVSVKSKKAGEGQNQRVNRCFLQFLYYRSLSFLFRRPANEVIDKCIVD